MTLGREAINPRPVQYAEIHAALAPFTAGFLSYSDGVHDDVNKIVWSGLAWDPDAPVRDILIEYARFFFAPDVAESAADGMLALEKNWIGSLRDNGGVEATLALWEGLERRAPQLEGNWRWQMCLVRAVYDAYTRHRLIHETALEQEANASLAEAEARARGRPWTTRWRSFVERRPTGHVPTFAAGSMSCARRSSVRSPCRPVCPNTRRAAPSVGASSTSSIIH